MKTKEFKPPKPLPKIPPYGPNAIDVQNLSFSYDSSNNNSLQNDKKKKFVLNGLNLKLAAGSRCLLLGANGSGKSTLLRILGGRHLPAEDSSVTVLGLNAFRDTRLNFHRAYLDCDWGMRSVAFAGAAVPLMADIPVYKMMERLQNSYPERRDELVELLGIDLYGWRMHQLSDGQRRRVQLLLGLIRPFQILLLDEITTSLDVTVRQDLLRWLVKESDERGATILYATHIFDGLDDWASHLLYLTRDGTCGWEGPVQELDLYHQLSNCGGGKMLAIADHWLRKELQQSRRFEKASGAMAHEFDPTDRQGGYASGRGLAKQIAIENNRKQVEEEKKTDNSAMDIDNEEATPLERRSRLSDMMGNRGVMAKHT